MNQKEKMEKELMVEYPNSSFEIKSRQSYYLRHSSRSDIMKVLQKYEIIEIRVGNIGPISKIVNIIITPEIIWQLVNGSSFLLVHEKKKELYTHDFVDEIKKIIGKKNTKIIENLYDHNSWEFKEKLAFTFKFNFK